MKKFNLLFISVLSLSTVYAQDITDALRYSQNEIQGTARFRAMSGAFGALGGDLSAVSLNPAGSVVFSNSQITFTGSNNYTKNETNYFNSMTNTNESCFGINQGGAAFVFVNRNSSSSWTKFAMSLNYERTNNFNDFWQARGTNTNDDGNFTNSVASFFYDYANGQRLVDISALPNESIDQAYRAIGNQFGYGNQQAFLGYESYIIDPEFDDDDNTTYFSNVAAGNFDHKHTYLATGYNGKMSFNFATQFEDKFSLGLNLNSHFINYERNTVLIEDNNNTGSTVTHIDFENNLLTTGAGFSFQLGGIFNITPDLRAGVVYDSPTWYSIDEETTQYISTVRDDSGTPTTQTVDPHIINVYPRYQLQTPGKITGSLAYIIAKRGIISFDYSNQNFSNTEFKPTHDPEFADQNALMSNVLTHVSTYRVGAEYRVINQLSLRGGYRYEDSPYKNGDIMSELQGFSAGIGYTFGNTKIDLTYDQASRSYENNLYNLNGGGSPFASIDRKNQNITLSLGFSI
ncbi:outer membrane protein transport protein [Tamlana sp. 2_MG-2023]|uniref:OmpP1/FadL family transporter n=1 Tax=unclassified Tamlana TaxID=2614803 RepID=UPI0026E464EA|nr:MULTISPECIES: outer membrane protein transport protein [unclassified Tamlana]MDO6760110.1 outer membrane protein transport protein [Tamlana sp. 2_MG-2023]MDO6790192.1 outer membrane protein transport protein [Tamlana sp. 1_MG-2023]